MKVVRKVVDNFSAMGQNFLMDDIVIINNNDVFQIYKEDHGEIGILRNYDTGNIVIETILDNSQDIDGMG